MPTQLTRPADDQLQSMMHRGGFAPAIGALRKAQSALWKCGPATAGIAAALAPIVATLTVAHYIIALAGFVRSQSDQVGMPNRFSLN